MDPIYTGKHDGSFIWLSQVDLQVFSYWWRLYFLCNNHANVVNSCRTVLVNDNISYLYMIYQAVVMGASLLAPATVSFIQMIVL